MNFRLTLLSFRLIKRFIWFFYTLFFIYTLVFIEKTELLFSVFFCGLLIQLTLIKFIKNWYKFKQPRLLDWFRLGTFASIVLNFLSLVGVFDKNHSITVNGVAEVSTDLVLPALFVVFIGLLALILAESIHVKFNNYNKNKRITYFHVFRHRRFFSFVTIIVLVIKGYLLLTGVTGYGVYEEYTTGQYSFLLQTLNILTTFTLAIYAVLKYIHKHSTAIFNTLFFTYLIAQIGFGFLSGMKEDIITPIIIVLIPYVIGGNKVPKKFIYLSLLFIILLYPITNNYRTVLNKNPNLTKTNAFKLGVSHTLDQGFIGSITSGTESYQSRFSLFPILMYSISEETKWDNYKYLNRYFYLPVGWIIPRVILPEKPVSNTGAELNYMLTGNNKSSITPSTYGWAFFEGGYIFVFTSFLILGLIISLLQTLLNKESLFHLILYIVVLVSLLKVESDIYFRLTSLFQTILIGSIVCLFFFKVKKTLRSNEANHNFIS